MRVVVSIGLALLFVICAVAQTPPPAAGTASASTAVMEWPEWLFPIHPPSLKKPPATPPKLDDIELLTIPDSTQKFTAARIGELAKEAQARGVAAEASRFRGSVPSAG